MAMVKKKSKEKLYDKLRLYCFLQMLIPQVIISYVLCFRLIKRKCALPPSFGNDYGSRILFFQWCPYDSVGDLPLHVHVVTK